MYALAAQNLGRETEPLRHLQTLGVDAAYLSQHTLGCTLKEAPQKRCLPPQTPRWAKKAQAAGVAAALYLVDAL